MCWKEGRKGRVRQLYECDDEVVLVTGDDISIHNKIIKSNIPSRGEILNAFSVFWFEKIKKDKVVPSAYKSDTGGELFEINPNRCILMKKLRMIPIEAVVRGYMTGELWRGYSDRRDRLYRICDNTLPSGLSWSGKLSEAIFTPTNKASNIYRSRSLDFSQMTGYIKSEGFSSEKAEEIGRKIREYALTLYKYAYREALKCGLIIADTKFEFGIDGNGEVLLGDECLTPDSTRYWPLANYQVGRAQVGFDKQEVREYVAVHPEAEELPSSLAEKLEQRYIDCLLMLKGVPWRLSGDLGLSGVKIHDLPKAI